MRSRSTAATVAALALLASAALAACSGDDSVGEVPAPASTTTSGSGTPSDTAEPSPSPAPRDTAVPRLAVEVVADGFEHGWDVGFLPDGKALVTERPGRISLVSGLREGARRTTVRADLGDLFVAGEGGLMGMVVHPDFATSREFTTCQTHQEGGEAKDIRLVTWRLSADEGSAQRVKTLLSGLPISSGRHSGCRPEIAADGALLVGTGDTAQGNIPQDRTILGGKVLRLDLETGQPLPDNPFASSSNRRERYVLSYGHRNVQGVAVRPGTGVVYTAEHGPTFNDEVNRIRPGANYGWDPSQGGTVGGYDESVPMTDRQALPRCRAGDLAVGDDDAGGVCGGVPRGVAVGRARGGAGGHGAEGREAAAADPQGGRHPGEGVGAEGDQRPLRPAPRGTDGARRCAVRDDDQRRRRQAPPDRPPPLTASPRLLRTPE